MATQQAQLEHLFRLLDAARTTTSLSLAGLVIIAYDHVLTFADEIEHIWKSRLSPANVFYSLALIPKAPLQIRYFTLVTMIINVVFIVQVEDSGSDKVTLMSNSYLGSHLTNSLVSVLNFQSASSTLVVVSADIVLAIRVWILYCRSQTLAWILFPILVAEMIAMLIVGYFSIQPLRHFVHAGSLVHGCYSLEVPRLLTYFSLPLLIVACIMFTLTIYKCGRTIHALGFGRTPLLEMFLRDGVFWFLATLLCCIFDFVVWSRGPPELARLPIIFTTGLLSVVGTRVLMNIKTAIAGSTDPSGRRIVESTMLHSGSRTITPFERMPARRLGQEPSGQATPWYLDSVVPTPATYPEW
ncbi:Ribosomal-protein-alanine acetyltransferase [Mycena indigotica]|uniref:Ribosomal-protein-alanine acetyltransferase n=1 Tax=Mycena indigotica TaxID=2126181 RepID=A0A8H6SNE6_9AGAR|nr:Ribosomal-protein-alanine acetyltransferase [Mycena indigotica]KAF7302228.1 Ribosomal-protein-alanine acetyltransferase [Mycena indigotica]